MSSPRFIPVGLGQILCLDGDAEGNLHRAERAVQRAAGAGARLVCLPESLVLGWVNPEAHTRADPIPGPASQRLAEMAVRHGVMICAGLDEKDGPNLYDAAVLIDAAGRILQRHRKINLLSHLMDPPYSPGREEDVAVVETAFGRVGLLICADTFVEPLVRRMAAQRADLLLVPYGWAAPAARWPDHGRELHATVARAARWAGCAVVGTDLVGMITHGPWTGHTYGGQSVVADREGRLLAVLADRDVDVQVIEVPLGRAD